MLNPVDVLNAVRSSTMSYTEAIHWACERISVEPGLADDPLWMDIAILRTGNHNEEVQVGTLLRRLIDASIDFRLTEETIKRYKAFAQDCKTDRITSLSIADFWPLMLGCVPDLIPCWEQDLMQRHGERLGVYVDEIGVLIRFTEQQIQHDRQEQLIALAESIELALHIGDDVVRNVVIAGFLEGVTNAWGHRPHQLPVERLVCRLRTHSVEALRELDRGWGTSTPGME